MTTMTTRDYEVVTDFFRQHMTMDQRRRLMAELPVQYKRMYPGVAPEVITDIVREALEPEDAK